MQHSYCPSQLEGLLHDDKYNCHVLQISLSVTPGTCGIVLLSINTSLNFRHYDLIDDYRNIVQTMSSRAVSSSVGSALGEAARPDMTNEYDGHNLANPISLEDFVFHIHPLRVVRSYMLTIAHWHEQPIRVISLDCHLYMSRYPVRRRQYTHPLDVVTETPPLTPGRGGIGRSRVAPWHSDDMMFVIPLWSIFLDHEARTKRKGGTLAEELAPSMVDAGHLQTQCRMQNQRYLYTPIVIEDVDNDCTTSYGHESSVDDDPGDDPFRHAGLCYLTFIASSSHIPSKVVELHLAPNDDRFLHQPRHQIIPSEVKESSAVMDDTAWQWQGQETLKKGPRHDAAHAASCKH